MAMKHTLRVLAEVDATQLFEPSEGRLGEVGSVDWRYCMEHANFAHQDEDACEFILHIGGGPGSESYADDTMAEMTKYGCTPEFIEAYAEARAAGATRVLFFA